MMIFTDAESRLRIAREAAATEAHHAPARPGRKRLLDRLRARRR